MKYSLINLLVTFVISVAISPLVIRFLRKLKFGQSILIYVEKHKSKSGTPTMGGIIFIVAGLVGYLLFAGSDRIFSSVAIISLVFFGVIGFLDDFIKIRYKHNEGLKPYQKIIAQFGVAIIIAIFVYKSPLMGSEVVIPFSSKTINLGLWIIPFVILVYLAIVNSVNLIDGLDGLCGSVSIISMVSFSVVLLLLSSSMSGVVLSETKGLVIVTMGLIGGVLGFLCFNTCPASCFMGDAGSLALGGYIASMFIVTRQYLLAIIIGLPFVITALSVIIQVVSYKLTKKRVFKMAPIHHHFEMSFSETKVVGNYIVGSIIVGILTIIFYL